MTIYLTDDDVAGRLHIDRKQVHALARKAAAEIAAGLRHADQLVGFKVGQKWRFTEDAFLTYTGEAAQTSTPAIQLLGLHPSTARSIRRRAS